MMDVIDGLDLGMLLDRNRIEACLLADDRERRLQRASDCMFVSGRMCSSRSSSVMPLMSFTGTTDFLKRPSLHAAAARFCDLHRIGIDVIARKTVFRRHQIGGNALRHEVSRDCRTAGPSPRRRRTSRYRRGSSTFDAAADRHVVLAGHDLRRGEIHRVETRRAEAVDLDTGHVIAVACRRVRRCAARSSPPPRLDRRSP